MIKALLIMVVWVSPNTYNIESYPVTFDNMHQCETAKYRIHFEHAKRLSVVAQDIICHKA